MRVDSSPGSGNARVLVGADQLFEAEFVSAGLAGVFNPFAATLINASARPDVLVPTRGTLDGPQPGRYSNIAPRGGPRPPRGCSKIASRMSDPAEAFPLVWIRAGRELAVVLHPIPARLDRSNLRLVFIDVIGSGHCGSPQLGGAKSADVFHGTCLVGYIAGFVGWQPPNHAPLKGGLAYRFFGKGVRAQSWHASLYRQRLRSGVPVIVTWASTEGITSAARYIVQ